jgi:CubicO group peptidase (beta-lactamase class C family)
MKPSSRGRKARIIALTAGPLLLVCAAATLHAAEGLAPAASARVDSAVKAVIDRQHIPGLSIAVVAGGEIRWQKAYGLADVENTVPAKTTTVYRIASTSKALTAVAALQLAERGTLDLDAPVQKYAPGFPIKAHPITTRQVLAHLSGIRHYRRGEGERTTRYESLTGALEVFKDDLLEHEPGARYTYTTFGYTLLGLVIEGASGMAYADYMRERVFEPAGMTRTRADDVYALVPDRARGYSPLVYGMFDGRWRNATLMDPSYKLPGGGLLSTSEDLARFAIALTGGKLLRDETFRHMWSTQKTRDGTETGYSYGWYVGSREGARPEVAIWHGGVQPGFTCTLWMLPERRFAVAVLTNLEGGGRLGLESLSRAIADIVLR